MVWQTVNNFKHFFSFFTYCLPLQKNESINNMERIHALIDKLSQQKQQSAPADQMLFTVQLIYQELVTLQQSQPASTSKRVAVTMPISFVPQEQGFFPTAQSTLPAAPAAEVEEKEIFFLDIPEEGAFEDEPETDSGNLFKEEEYKLAPPASEKIKAEAPAPETRPQEKPVYIPQQLFNPAFEQVTEAPTLQYQDRVELHHKISEQKESLNDRLKQDNTELAHRLKDSPIKDLRKGIGINDRFTFVKELFRGDEAMYERSIKTINNFNIFSEAEYWMTRELKFKLGWDDSTPMVQHFYQLVRRRFS